MHERLALDRDATLARWPGRQLPLEQLEREAWLVGQVIANRASDLQHLLFRHDAHRRAPLPKLPAPILAAREQHLAAQRVTELLRNDVGSPETRGEPVLHEIRGVERLVSHHD